MIEDIEGEFFEEEEVVRFEHFKLSVDQGQTPVRIDRFLTDKMANATRNRVQNAIDLGSVQINGKPPKPIIKLNPVM